MFWYLVIAFYFVNGIFAAAYGLSGRMRYTRPWLGLLFIAAPFAWTLGLIFLLDTIHGMPSSNTTEVRGTVFMRQRGKDTWGLEHDELTITIEDTKEMVKANLIGDPAQKIPDEVTFHYTGDPSREVRLKEESNVFWMGLCLLGVPLFGGFVLFSLDRKAARIESAALSPPSS